MYTGNLIEGLTEIVARAEMRAEEKRIADEQELERLFQLQGPAMHSERMLAGAA